MSKMQSNAKEVDIMDLGAFTLTDLMGYRYSDVYVQNFFNAAMWKKYYIAKDNTFYSVDIRDGKIVKCRIVRETITPETQNPIHKIWVTS